jgi:hypothetical protein
VEGTITDAHQAFREGYAGCVGGVGVGLPWYYRSKPLTFPLSVALFSSALLSRAVPVDREGILFKDR